jgi:hypothetical protein
MSERRLKLMDIREMIRHIREGRSDRQIGKDLGVDRRTVKRSRRWRSVAEDLWRGVGEYEWSIYV